MNRTENSRALRCDETEALIERFAEHTLPAEDAQAMRAHLVACADCARSYRESVESVGRSAAAAREARERRAEEAAQSAKLRERVAGQVEPAKHRNWRLRTLLLPAFFMVLMVQVVRSQRPREAFHVEGAIGAVEITGRPIGSYGEHEIVMRRGARCITERNGSARLAGPDCALGVGERTQLLVVDFDPPRVQLHVGSLNVEGTVTVETQLGILRARGAAARGRILLDADGLLVAPSGGAWSFQDADGEVTLEPGAERRFLP